MTDTDTQAPATVGTLTADDLAVLRTNTDVSLHHHKGQGYVRAYLNKHDDNRTFTAREQRLYPRIGPFGDHSRMREILVPSTGYGHSSDSSGQNWSFETESDAYAYTTLYGDEMASAAHVAAVGDFATLSWTADNNNDNIRSVGYHCDEVRIMFSRELKSDRLGRRRKTFTFLLRCEVGPDNSARMIRRYGPVQLRRG